MPTVPKAPTYLNSYPIDQPENRAPPVSIRPSVAQPSQVSEPYLLMAAALQKKAPR